MKKFGKIILTPESTEEEYIELYLEKVGTIFKIEGDYETVIRRIQDYKPEPITFFEVTPVNPGTNLYTMYGANHLVVTEKV